MNKNINKGKDKNKITGGKIIASGGFGCIFKPALQCENQNSREDNKITKLMTIKHATDEYNEIQKIKSILQVIPNYENYFLLNNINLCKPTQLTNKDLIKYDKKCKALTKKGIYSKNVNQSLNQILALNMPDGGINLEKYIQDNFVSSSLIHMNNKLIELLTKGIVLMNDLHVFHCDIKDSNMLVDLSNSKMFQVRLIDWGLSIVRPNRLGIPKKLYRRPFQYNVPFSSVLFNKEFQKLYHEFLSVNTNPDYFQMREFVTNYIFIWNNIRGSGHLNVINDIVKVLTEKELFAIQKSNIKEDTLNYEFTNYYIVEYLSKILQEYTINSNFQLTNYFHNVFLKNIDIWGFVMSYVYIIERLHANFEKLQESQMDLFLKLKYIIIHFLYETPTQPINIGDLVTELTNLNVFFQKINIQGISKKLHYLKKNKNDISGKFKHVNKTKNTKKHIKRNNNNNSRKI